MRLKKQWVSFNKEFRGQFPNFKFSSRYTLGFLLLTSLYLYYLNTSFLSPQREVLLAPLILAREEIISPTPTILQPQKVIVPVLTYHYIQDSGGESSLTQSLSISPAKLDQQLQFLIKNGYETIDPEQLYLATQGALKLPPKPVLLTFDDGYKDFYTFAYPLLQKYGLKATSFVAVGLLGNNQYMNKEAVQILARDSLITIGSHTIYHPDLTSSTSNSAWDEIANGKKLLEELIGREVPSFAYPFGLFNEKISEQVRSAGFKIAFSTEAGWEHSSENILVLPRLTMHENSLPLSLQKSP